MAGKRDCIINFINYIESLGITINIAKNKARGNKGFFKAQKSVYRIDVTKGLNEEETLKVLVHEFVHYIHYINDNTLKSVEFLFDDKFTIFEDDLIKLTVASLPKVSVEPIFNKYNQLKTEIKDMTQIVKIFDSDFKISKSSEKIENKISKSDCRYLLKYDRVKVFNGFKFKTYSIDNLDDDFANIDEECRLYIKLHAKRRALKRLTSKISRLNKYYNNKSELIARSFEYFITNPQYMKTNTPLLYNYYESLRKNNKNTLITTMLSILKDSAS